MEGEKKPLEILVVYRSNRLFDHYSKEVVDYLKKEGAQVKMEVFPIGTSQNKIREWYKQNKDRINQYYVLSDNTTINSVLPESLGKKPLRSLDDIFREATEKATIYAVAGVEEEIGKSKTGRSYTFSSVAGAIKELEKDPENPKKREKYFNELGKLYKHVLEFLPENEKEKEFYIIKGLRDMPTLVEHEPTGLGTYYHLWGFLPLNLDFNSPDEVGGYYKAGAKALLKGRVQSDEEWDKIKSLSDELAKVMKQYFKEAGIKHVKIVDSVAEMTQDEIDKIKNKQAYLIFDRHTPTKANKPWKEDQRLEALYKVQTEKLKEFWGKYLNEADSLRKMALELPIESFVDSIREKIGFKIESKRMENALKKSLEKILSNILRDLKGEK